MFSDINQQELKKIRVKKIRVKTKIVNKRITLLSQIIG